MNKNVKGKMLVVTVFGMLLSGVGCVHNAHARGSVVLKHSDIEADVCLGKNEVKPGDKVTVFKNECRDGVMTRENDRFSCKKIKVGDGEITSNLNEHYSTMKVGPEVPIAEGMIVEK